MPRLRTYAEIIKLTDLSVAERRLLVECPTGKPTDLGTECPQAATDENRVRAEILRYLILGGCDACRPDEVGVRLSGAFVTGQLDLAFTTARGGTTLIWCHFDHGIFALDARLRTLILSGSRVPGLNAHGARVTGNLFLRDVFAASGEVNLSGAKIGGQLDCTGGRFDNAEGHALNAQGARVTGDVFLQGGFAASGEVNLSGAKIGGQLACTGGRFDNAEGHALNAQGARVTGAVFLSYGFAARGEVSLTGAEIGGQLACDGGRFDNARGNALIAQGARVTEGFFWRKVTVAAGSIVLSSAQAGDLVDDLASWPEQAGDGSARLLLHGFAYHRIRGNFTDARQRLEWLRRGTVWEGTFYPQPYEQLAKVLGEMGHAEGRRQVLMARERTQRATELSAVKGYLLFAAPRRALMWFWDRLLDWGVGYGYKPHYSLCWALILIGIGWGVAFMAWTTGTFAPNSDVIVNSAEWQVLARDPAIANPAEVWSTSHDPATLRAAMPARCADPALPECIQGQGMDYEAFHSLAYAVDVVVPLVVLGQEATWAPSKDRGGWGWHLWWLRWVLAIGGWIVTAFGAAAVTGLIRRD